MKIRKHGEGTFGQHKGTGLEYYRIRTGVDERGRQTARFIYRGKKESSQEFRKRASDLRQRVNARDYVRGRSYTVNDLVTLWLKDGCDGGPKTIEGYVSTHKKHIETMLGRDKADGLKPLQITAYYRYLSDHGRTADTVYRVHRLLRAALGFAYRMEAVQHNPMSRVSAPKVERQERGSLTVPEVKRFLAAALAHEHGAYMYTLVATAARPNEIARICKSDVFLDEQPAYIRIRGRKTENADRVVFVTSRTAEVLRGRLAAMSPESELVFTGSRRGRGLPVNVRNITSKVLPAILKEAGIHKHVTSYGLRHSGINVARAAGMSEMARHDRHGHEDGKSELAYQHVDHTVQSAELAKLEALI